ncbi:hypothetical protein GLYMA_07G228800v4 [Glycine max]|nr:hypothetical protein GLYMA_07G228800v4 [Glycine max]KAH1088186.1 hypothetical protein GYH30_019296 [Glycine max]
MSRVPTHLLYNIHSVLHVVNTSILKDCRVWFGRVRRRPIDTMIVLEFWCTNKEVNILVNEEARLARQTKLSAHEAAWKASWQAFGGYWEKI